MENKEKSLSNKSFLLANSSDLGIFLFKETILSNYKDPIIEFATNGRILVDLIKNGYRPDVIITNMRLTRIDIHSAIIKIREIMPDAKFIAYSSLPFLTEDDVKGFNAFVSMYMRNIKLVSVINDVIEHGSYLGKEKLYDICPLPSMNFIKK